MSAASSGGASSGGASRGGATNGGAPSGAGGGTAETTLHIRAATNADLSRIAAIERSAFSDPWSASSFRSLLSSPSAWFRLAEERPGGEIVGYVVALRAVDDAEIANLAVDPARRGRGIGARLLDHAIRAVSALGVQRIYLEVRDSNTVARTLYASRGFREVGRRRNYYRRPAEDALVLCLSLPVE